MRILPFLVVVLFTIPVTGVLPEEKMQQEQGGAYQPATNPIRVHFETDGSLPMSFGYYDSVFNFHFVRLLSGKHENDELVLTNSRKHIIYNISGSNCPYILYAGDHIKVSIAGKQLTVSSVNNTGRNKDLAFFPQLLRDKNLLSLASLLPSEQAALSGTTTFSLHTDSVFKQRLQNFNNYLDRYAALYHLQTGSVNDIRKLLYNEYLLNLLSPVTGSARSQNYDNNTVSLIDSRRSEFADSADFFAYSFRRALYQYNKYLCRENLDRSNSFDEQYRSAKTNFSGAFKNYLLFELMKTAYIKDRTVFNSFYASFLTDCRNENYRNYFINLNNKEQSVSGAYLLKEVTGRLVKLDDLIKTKKTRLVFIDLWASWCLPCISSFPKIQDLQKKHAGSNISFLFLSLDNNEADWKKTAAKFSHVMDRSTSYLLMNEFKSSFARKNNITTIPRYMILDNAGNMVVQDFDVSDLVRAGNEIAGLVDKYEKK